jgi:hypothetical protein
MTTRLTIEARSGCTHSDSKQMGHDDIIHVHVSWLLHSLDRTTPPTCQGRQGMLKNPFSSKPFHHARARRFRASRFRSHLCSTGWRPSASADARRGRHRQQRHTPPPAATGTHTPRTNTQVVSHTTQARMLTRFKQRKRSLVWFIGRPQDQIVAEIV